MEKKPHKYIFYLLSYMYVFIGFSYIIYDLSYSIRIANKPEGWAVLMFCVLLSFIVYTAINHIFISRILSHKLLLIIEVLLFVSMVTLIISDVRYEEYCSLQYLQRTTPVKVTPNPGY